MWTINVVYLVVQTTILNFCVKKSVFFTHISEYIFVLKSVILLKYICNVKLQDWWYYRNPLSTAKKYKINSKECCKTVTFSSTAFFILCIFILIRKKKLQLLNFVFKVL